MCSCGTIELWGLLRQVLGNESILAKYHGNGAVLTGEVEALPVMHVGLLADRTTLKATREADHSFYIIFYLQTVIVYCCYAEEKMSITSSHPEMLHICPFMADPMWVKRPKDLYVEKI